MNGDGPNSRPGCRRKILSKEFWGWGWGSKADPQEIFSLRDNFRLKIAFPFPQNGQLSHEMKGLRKRSFYRLRKALLTVGAFLLTVKLLCLQSFRALVRRSFPL